MSFVYTATDPTGKPHCASNRDAFVALLHSLRLQFPDGFILVRADFADEQPVGQAVSA